MAIVLKGMTAEETGWLTAAMTASGRRLDLDALPGPKVDKHSTGGVGDKTSIVLAPLVAACGVIVPMMSGRGLGHTGGTLDKLEAIPGFRTELDPSEVTSVLRRAGCCIFSQSSEIAPADGRLYALRDVTATVESIPLITASILSKKLAEGLDALVMDVKVGRGAFMKTEVAARALAESLVETGRQQGVRVEALLTRMDAPLGRAVGNALEVVECVETLKGRGPADVTALSLQLAARMVLLSGLAGEAGEAERLVRRALESGAGLDKWREIVAHQGGDPRTVDDYRLLPSAPGRHLVRAAQDGYLSALDAERLGHASVALGAGRSRVEDTVDPGVGIVAHAAPGDPLREGDPVLEVHYRDDAGLGAALELLAGAIAIDGDPPAVPPLIVEEIA
jgi:pyrimidine-nucleoside phosphorylase